MSANLIISDPSKPIVSEVQRYLRQMQQAGDGLRRAFDAMAAAADGTDEAEDFDVLVSRGGYQSGDYADANTAAKASFDQINSVIGNYESVTAAAVNQAMAYHGWA